MTKNTFVARVKGGPGSGDWGHTGRPGQRGGSAGKGAAGIGGSGMNAEEIIRKYRVMKGASLVPDDSLAFIHDNAVRDITRFPARHTRKGKATHKKLSDAYEKAGFQNKGVAGYYIVPKTGEFAGLPMHVTGRQSMGSKKSDWSWRAAPMFPPQKWDKKQRKWVDSPKGKAVSEGIDVVIPASEI